VIIERQGNRGAAVWRLHTCRPEHGAAWYGEDPVLAGLPTLRESANAHGTRPGQEFLICSDGRVVSAVNAFLASPLRQTADPCSRRHL
jgi:hypothetical protein